MYKCYFSDCFLRKGRQNYSVFQKEKSKRLEKSLKILICVASSHEIYLQITWRGHKPHVGNLCFKASLHPVMLKSGASHFCPTTLNSESNANVTKNFYKIVNIRRLSGITQDICAFLATVHLMRGIKVCFQIVVREHTAR